MNDDSQQIDDNELMRNAVKEQIASPGRRKKDHIKLSKIWGATQAIKSIQAELVAGYSFDKPQLEQLVNAMFSFINGIVSPTQNVKASDVQVEEVVKK